MDKLTKKQRVRLEKVTEELYKFSKTRVPQKELREFEAPAGSFVFTPNSMSKKDFQFFVVRWMDLMEERNKKAKEKLKKNNRKIKNK